jgi:hypothetical protein
VRRSSGRKRASLFWAARNRVSRLRNLRAIAICNTAMARIHRPPRSTGFMPRSWPSSQRLGIMKDCAARQNGLNHIGRKIDGDENCAGAQACTGKHGKESRNESGGRVAMNGHFRHLHTCYLQHGNLATAGVPVPGSNLVIRGENVSSVLQQPGQPAAVWDCTRSALPVDGDDAGIQPMKVEAPAVCRRVLQVEPGDGLPRLSVRTVGPWGAAPTPAPAPWSFHRPERRGPP